MSSLPLPTTNQSLLYIQDMKTGMSKGFGFVRMRSDVDFKRVLEEKHHFIEGMEVFVKQYTVENKKAQRKNKLGTPVDVETIDSTSNASYSDEVVDDDNVNCSSTTGQ